MPRPVAQAKVVKPVPKAPAAAEAVTGVVPQQIEEAKPAVETATTEAPIALEVAEGVGVEISNSEQLREAIVHYEIFGRCIGLREPQEQAWMK